MGGSPTQPNDQSLVNYSGKSAAPVGAASKLPVGRFDARGNAMLSPEQQAEDVAAMGVEKAGTANFYTRDSSKPASHTEESANEINKGLK